MQIPAAIRISIKPYKGKPLLLELVQVSKGRCIVRRDGSRSRKISETTPTEVGRLIGRYVSAEMPRAAMRRAVSAER